MWKPVPSGFARRTPGNVAQVSVRFQAMNIAVTNSGISIVPAKQKRSAVSVPSSFRVLRSRLRRTAGFVRVITTYVINTRDAHVLLSSMTVRMLRGAVLRDNIRMELKIPMWVQLAKGL